MDSKEEGDDRLPPLLVVMFKLSDFALVAVNLPL